MVGQPAVTDELAPQGRPLPHRQLRQTILKKFSTGKAQHRIPEKFQPLMVPPQAGTGVGEGFMEGTQVWGVTWRQGKPESLKQPVEGAAAIGIGLGTDHGRGLEGKAGRKPGSVLRPAGPTGGDHLSGTAVTDGLKRRRKRNR